MHSVTDLANMALSRLGEPEISDYNENSPTAIKVRRQYELTRDSLLRGHQWSFATDRATLSQNADAPPFGWSHSYALPADCLHVNTLNGDEAKRTDAHFRIEGKNILANTSSAQITYVKRITDTGQFDPLFVEALILKLAANLAQTITQSSQKKSEILAEYAQLALPEAETVDANEEDPVIRSISSRSRHVAGRTLSGMGVNTGRAYGAELPTDPGIHQGDPGANGYSPVFAVVSDGDRRVLQVANWTGGTGGTPETGFVGPSGIVAAAGNAVDVRGVIGLTGDDGWSPILAAVQDGERRVFRVVDWVGGEGTKPATGDYLSAAGLTASISAATNVRGPAGTGDITGPGVTVTEDNLASFADDTGGAIEDSGITKASVTGSIAKTDFLTVTGGIDLDQIAIDVEDNNAKETNAEHTGDVTGDSALTIEDDAVTFAKMQNLTTQRVIGRNTAGTGDPEEVQLSDLFDWVSGSVANGDILVRTAGTWNRLAVGTDGQSLVVSSGVPSWQDGSGDLVFGQAFHIADVKAFNVNGGTFTAGAPRTRDLTTRISGSGFVSLASNQFTPIAGTWFISWSSPARGVSRHWTSLVNATAETTVQVGSAAQSTSTAAVTVSSGWAVVVCNGTDAFEIQHECQTTLATTGFGMNTNKSGVDSIYTQVFGNRIA